MSYFGSVQVRNTADTLIDPATETTLLAINTKVPTLVSGRVPVDGSGVTQPISAAALPLPSGASTSALQTTGNSSLSSIDGKLGSLGQKLMTGSAPVVIASDQSTVPVSIGLPTYLDKTFGFAIGINQPSAGTDNPLIFLKNPTGSGKIIYLKFVSYGTAVANVSGVIRIYKNPTTTANGTAQTIVQFGTASTAMQLFTVPTVTSNGTMEQTAATGQNSNSLLIDFAYEIQVAANSTILITGNPGSNNRQAEISMRWIEL